MMENDTICALATATGGALGLIRVSGRNTFETVQPLFSKRLKKQGHQYGHIIGVSDEIVDEVLLSLFKAPNSYTGEDTIEISCHGSTYVLKTVLGLLTQQGCRMAEPGEFTRRAFMNGKMDLSQAEAVADLIAATNRGTHHMAISQLKGGISSELSQLREKLLHLTSLLELELDFSDHEDLEFADRTELLTLAQTIEKHVTRLAKTFETGKAIKQGIPVAIVGKTNVGKSTLLNCLLKDERAIVSTIHGTTRDTIEDTMNIHGIQFRFIDTAGLRSTTDSIEQIGIERTYKAIERSTIVLWLVDEQPSDSDTANMTERCQGKTLILIQNKTDLHPSPINVPHGIHSFIAISAKQGKETDTLEEIIYKAANMPEIKDTDVIVTSARHYEALTNALTNLQRVIDGLQSSLSGDLIAEDLRLVLTNLSDITGGTITSQETLNNIFSHFCVGK